MLNGSNEGLSSSCGLRLGAPPNYDGSIWRYSFDDEAAAFLTGPVIIKDLLNEFVYRLMEQSLYFLKLIWQ